jgi:uncharacterized membrane protein YgdD (TMEM256/DUF423 family)
MSAERLLGIAAGLIGAAGIGLAAAGAHLEPGSSLGAAALIALVHAPAILAVLAARRTGLAHPRAGLIAALGMALGTLLFAGDISLRVFAKTPLFPMAAPSGGMLLIASWLVITVACALARPNRD